jgi:hypothetical protein
MVLQSLQRVTKRKAPLEHYEQASFISRVEWLMPQLVDYVAAVPNGGKRDRITAARLKREGVRPKFPDLIVLLARGGYFGLLIEFKRQGVKRADDGQMEKQALYRAQGYRVETCAGCEAAWRVFTEYVTSDQTKVQRPHGTMAGPRAGAFDV